MDEKFGFERALTLLKDGEVVQRTGWNGKGMYLYVRTLEGLRPFVVLKGADGFHVPWTPSQTDLLAEDWCVYREVQVVPTPPGSHSRGDLDAAWFRTNGKDYVGKWVAVRNGVLIAHGDDRTEVRDHARRILEENQSYVLSKVFGTYTKEE